MRITTFARGTEANLEKRKLQLARREMDQAYKKNAKYADAAKNPMLLVLENLLSGKTEKELHESDLADKQYKVLEEQLQRDEKLQLGKMKQEMKNGLSTDQELDANKQSNHLIAKDATALTMHTSVADDSDYINNRNSLSMLINPSPQDLRVLASASPVHSAGLTEGSFEEHESDRVPYEDISFDVNIPKQFLTNVERDAEAETVFGKDIEKLILNRTYNKAKTIYTKHIGMVSNGYRSYNEPLFTRTA